MYPMQQLMDGERNAMTILINRRKICHVFRVKHCIATSSCLYANGARRDWSWCRQRSNLEIQIDHAAAPILHLKAKPIFVDMLPESWCIDPDQVEEP